MATVKGKNNTYKRKGIFEWIFPKKTREWRCDECGRPFLEHPDREPMRRFVKGNVELLLYEDRSALKETFKLRIGVWRTSHDGFYFGQLFSREDVNGLDYVITEAVEFVQGYEEVKRTQAIVKMSSRSQ